MHGICTQLTGEGHMNCNGIQYIYAWLTRGSICLLYICIVLDLAMDVAACKASVFDLMGRATSSVMVFKASMFECLRGSMCLLYICIVLDVVVGVVACKTSMLKWPRVHLSSIYMHCPRSSCGCSGMQGIYSQMTGGSICFLYIYIVLDLAVGVAVCKASLLN